MMKQEIGYEVRQGSDGVLDFLLTKWADGTHELAVRPAGSGAVWSPPSLLEVSA